LGEWVAWQILDTGVGTAEHNMRSDWELLEALRPDSDPILHLYEWEKPSATYGYFVQPEEFLSLEGVKKRGVDIARRPTGGGIVFHIWDFAFSVLIPADHPRYSRETLENYRFINDAVLESVKTFLTAPEQLQLIPQDERALDLKCQRFCMAQPTQYDVVLEGRKVAGAAQRKRKGGFLHQGTIALTMPCEETLSDVLLPGMRVSEAMGLFTYPLLGKNPTAQALQEIKQELKQRLTITLGRE
jgi:lipoate-protein ligase A